MGRRAAGRRLVSERRPVHRPAELGWQLEQRRAERQHRVARTRGPFRKEHHALPRGERRLDPLEHPVELALGLAVDEDRVDRAAEGAEQRPAVDLGLGDEDARQLGAEDDDVEVGAVIRHQHERRAWRRPLDPDPHPQGATETAAPEAEGQALDPHPRPRPRRQQERRHQRQQVAGQGDRGGQDEAQDRARPADPARLRGRGGRGG